MKGTQLSFETPDTDESLTRRTARSGIWVFSVRIAQELARIAKLIIIARLLAPEDFGLMGIALLTLAAVETFTQPGFEQALIQKKEDARDYLDSAWTLLVLRGVVLSIALFILAPFMAKFFRAPEAGSIIQATALLVLIHGFYNIGIIYFKKDLKFNKIFIFEFIGTLTELIVTVIAVLILRNVWALVFGLLASNSVKCLLSYILHPYRPRFSLKKQQAVELWRFGRWVLGSTVLIFLVTEGDDILVGRLLGATALGLYQMAYRISNMPATEITHVVSQVTFPAYSKIQDERRRLGAAFIKVVNLVALLSFPISVFIFIFASDFTSIILGDKWMPMVSSMRILVIGGLIRSIMATTGPIIYAVGKPKLETAFQTVRFLILAGMIYPFIRMWGIEGASLVVVVSTVISTVGLIYMAIKLTRCGFLTFLKALLIPAFNTALIGVVYYLLRPILGEGLVAFILLTVACIATYSIAVFISVFLFNYNVKGSFQEIFRSFRRRH